MADSTVVISVGRHQLAATVFGEGSPAVVIEPSFRGAAEDWERIARTLAEETKVVWCARSGERLAVVSRGTPSPR
jgi:hypothetical protein